MNFEVVLRLAQRRICLHSASTEMNDFLARVNGSSMAEVGEARIKELKMIQMRLELSVPQWSCFRWRASDADAGDDEAVDSSRVITPVG